jgi:hypothetical protein
MNDLYRSRRRSLKIFKERSIYKENMECKKDLIMDWFELDKDDEETIADITEESQLNLLL